MNAAALNEIITLGAITGLRSMAGPMTLAFRHHGVLKRVVAVMAVGEIIADKTALVGDRVAPLPIAGRALMGGLVGGVIARQEHGSVLAGGLIGAAAATIATHLGYHARKRLPVPNALGGVIEDAIVVGVGASYALRSANRSA